MNSSSPKLLKTEDRENMDKLFKEADEIINRSTDENLKNIWNKIAKWKDDGSDEEMYYQEFIRVMMAMSLLNFSERMPYLSNGKTLLNLISHTINHVNDDLQDKVFPVNLLSLVFGELNLNKNVVILTDYEGSIKYYYSGFAKIPVNLNGVKISMLFEDKKVFDELQLFQPKEGVITNIKYLPQSKVRVKAVSTRFKYAEGIAYIIDIL